MRNALVTGCSGFIGFFVCQKLLSDGWKVTGIDNLNSYYDKNLKLDRQTLLSQNSNFEVINEHIESPGILHNLAKNCCPDLIIHLAGQAGVRNSIDNPRPYFSSNLQGTFEVLEVAKYSKPKHLLIASSSSVYGSNKSMPYKESDKADSQISFYAASKKASEIMAHSYSDLYSIPITAYRFFTVYGPWGRPDMAAMKFAHAICKGLPIDIYNHGRMERDFTFIDDLVEGIALLVDKPPKAQTSNSGKASDSDSSAPFRVVNIGNSNPVRLDEFIRELERALGMSAKKIFLDSQPGDVAATWADNSLLKNLTGFEPQTDLATGISKFVEWFKSYYSL